METILIPKFLKLKGFAGVWYAFGRDELTLDLRTIPADAMLVAFIGPNGSAKTTILENLHPYRVMPSHSTTLGPGGFSYWDVIVGATAQKELEWGHGGVDYRTVLSMRVAGKSQKADSYLYRWDVATSNWTPVVLADGTVSDGKSSTYDACVDDILGPPERFFTSQFSAQKKKTLAEYDVGDIKSILASVLHLGEFRSLSAKAGQVAKFLKQGLDRMNAELDQARQHDAQVEIASSELGRLATSLAAEKADEQVRLEAVDLARQELALREAKRDSQARDIAERKFLTEQVAAARSKAAERVAEQKSQFEGKRLAITADIATCTAEQARTRQAISAAQQELTRLRPMLALRDDVVLAQAETGLAATVLGELDQAIDACKAELSSAGADRAAMQRLVADKAKIVSEGHAQKSVLENLKVTASLIGEVPCGGTGFQSKCKLLDNARNAAAAIPVTEESLGDKRKARDALVAQIEALQVKLDVYTAVEAKLTQLEARRRETSDKISRATATAAKLPMVEEAERRVPAIEAEMAERESAMASATSRLETLQQQLGSLSTETQRAIQSIEAELASTLQQYQERLDSLAVPVTDAEIDEAKRRAEQANRAVLDCRARQAALTTQQTSAAGRLEAARALAARSTHIKQQAERCSEEIARFKRLEKGLGNDGCVALSIDDAGPEIASVCNQLLKECFNGRFTVRLDTQSELKNGNMKETFEVYVFDTLRPEKGKPLGMMSGGEEVIVNEYLTRSIALYAAQSSDAGYQTLFTDETDGPFDPQVKRTFMEMKRAVLKKGGYLREYFITHTPELWALADYTIDVTKL